MGIFIALMIGLVMIMGIPIYLMWVRMDEQDRKIDGIRDDLTRNYELDSTRDSQIDSLR